MFWPRTNFDEVYEGAAKPVVNSAIDRLYIIIYVVTTFNLAF